MTERQEQANVAVVTAAAAAEARALAVATAADHDSDSSSSSSDTTTDGDIHALDRAIRASSLTFIAAKDAGGAKNNNMDTKIPATTRITTTAKTQGGGGGARKAKRPQKYTDSLSEEFSIEDGQTGGGGGGTAAGAGNTREDPNFNNSNNKPSARGRTVVAVTEAQDVDHEFNTNKFPVREWQFASPITGVGPSAQVIAFNPTVSLIGIFCLWGLSIWCMVDPAGSKETLVGWRGKITLYFSWLFVAARMIFFFFSMYILCRYHAIKLGPANSQPEHDNSTYFTMIFVAGVAVGLFVYGVSEPLWHQESHWFAAAGYHSQDDIDVFAINLTVNDWGIAGWAPYLIVALAMSLAGHRFHLPMTFRSCLYPIFGDYTWGWIGDCIDGFNIVVAVTGICTSLGLGAVQIVSGFQSLGWIGADASPGRLKTIQNCTIWAVTMIATISVLYGVKTGIKGLSLVTMALGLILLFLVFAMDNTKHLLNLMVQETGYFLQHLIEINFWTDAYGQLKPGEGRAIDGNASATWWMDSWAIFYQAWWISWSSWVGMFIARISRGRTVGEVVLYAMILPVAFCLVWFTIWGGIGIRQARQAKELEQLGLTFFNDSSYYQVAGSKYCFDVPQTTESLDNGTVIFENTLLGVTPVCKFDSEQAVYAAYNVLHSFTFHDTYPNGLGNTMTVLFILSLTLFFATSADSATLIVDYLASNGRIKHNWIQRLFWAVTTGAVATALLSQGGTASLGAVQAASIVIALPFVFLLFFTCHAIQLFCEQAAQTDFVGDYKIPDQPVFAVPVYGGIFNIFEWLASLGTSHPKRVDLGIDAPSTFHVVEFGKGMIVPPYSLYQVLRAAHPKSPHTNLLYAGLYGFFYVSWIGVVAASFHNDGIVYWGWVALLANGFLLARTRSNFRARYNLRSNMLTDLIASLFLWPQVLTQMRQHCVDLDLDHAVNPEQSLDN